LNCSIRSVNKKKKKKKNNIINISPGSKYSAEEIQDEVEAFHIIFSIQMVDEIIHYADTYISTITIKKIGMLNL